jgi:hypothetical protein
MVLEPQLHDGPWQSMAQLALPTQHFDTKFVTDVFVLHVPGFSPEEQSPAHGHLAFVKRDQV